MLNIKEFKYSNNILTFSLIITSIAALIPVIMKLLKYLPDMIKVSFPFEQVVRLKSDNIFLENSINIAALIMIFTLVIYLLLRLLKNVEGKSYYKMLFLPLVIAILFLLQQINIILGIFI